MVLATLGCGSLVARLNSPQTTATATTAPTVRYGWAECSPGSSVGPCVNEKCGHTDCNKARELSKRTCPICRSPLGFGKKVSIVVPSMGIRDYGWAFEGSDGLMAHLDCVRRDMPERCARCGITLTESTSDIVDGHVVHDKLECNRMMFINDFDGVKLND